MFKVQIKNINKLTNDLRRLNKSIESKIDLVTKVSAQEIELRAKQKAPVDLGFLKNNIATEKVADSDYKVVANASYSAYMEFGTGGEIEVPNEMQEIASQFIGKGIKTINIRPRPFLYPAFIEGRDIYIKELTKMLDKETKSI